MTDQTTDVELRRYDPISKAWVLEARFRLFSYACAAARVLSMSAHLYRVVDRRPRFGDDGEIGEIGTTVYYHNGQRDPAGIDHEGYDHG